MANWQLGAGMLALGLNWWHTLLATLVGHIVAAGLVVLVSYPGLEYHISFPVASRIGWGFFGAVFVVLNRIVLSVIWFGVQSWMGGLVTYVCLRAIWPSIDNIPNTIPASTGMNLPQFVGFIVFFVIQFPCLFLTPKTLRWLLQIGSWTGFVVQLVLVAWACSTMGSGGFGSVLSSARASSLSSKQLGWLFVYAMSLTMSSITSGTLSVCDYTRFAKRPSSGTWPQLAGFFPAWISNLFGVLTVAATQNRFGAELWSPAGLLMAMQQANPTSATRAAVFFAAFGMGISQLSLNIIGNSFSGGTDMAALLPRFINIRRGQILTAILGLAINPWYLLSGATVFLSTMSSYTVFLQPFLGILVGHYLVIQKRKLRVIDLYRLGSDSIYFYSFGINYRAVIAWIAGMAPHVPGFLSVVNPHIKVSEGAMYMYYLNSLTGFVFAFAVTILLDFISPVTQQKEFISSVTRNEAMKEYEENHDPLVINATSVMKREECEPQSNLPCSKELV
ncbi:uncharacterized protein E0L32_010902 [Thyridium curvatum]|uniref:Uncharacterized protein n=1 Tax=Thyridium curvatum TaxID=1093900 RepID=A0A507AQP3_9PEZI|nr:uncharacterized protein E0L32_010902 [Thyridium curvatum]TPX07199.1 hypothetical protein E0L32_010902 [Thyridium curvatum]